MRNKNYISRTGGVTISGGEPTMQIDFLRSILQGSKSFGLHTAVDTSGYVDIEDIEKILDFTDLFIIDIKHMDAEKCRELTGESNEKVLELLEYLEKRGKEVWIRNVLYQGFTDDEEHIARLGRYVKELKNVTRLEILPYHDMAKEKYEKLNMDYRAKNQKNYNSRTIEEYKMKYEKYYKGKIVI